MAETAIPGGGPRDRVAMLSVSRDGTPDQHDPEIIGDKEFALAATKEQFRQQAVSAVDDEKRPELFGTLGAAEEVGQDPKIEELQKAHQAAEKSAEGAAESAVNALFVEAQPAQATVTSPKVAGGKDK